MFFAIPASVPFETISDVLEGYPEWKLMFMDDSIKWVQNLAQQGDQDFISLWQRYENHPTETTYDSIEHGLQLIEKGQNVICVSRNKLLGHLKSNPTKQMIHVVNIGKVQFSHFILHKNSPLLPMFNQGASYFRETGLERQLFYKWFGNLDKPSGSTPSEGNILTLGHMVTVFVAMLALFVIALFVLCGELTFKWLPGSKRMWSKNFSSGTILYD